MRRRMLTWPFVVGALACAAVGGSPVSLANPWHVASVICAVVFLVLALRGNR